jgi:hypothetical protein
LGVASNKDTAADLTLENDGVGSAAGVEAALEARRRVRTRCGAAGPLVSNSSLAYPYSCGDDYDDLMLLIMLVVPMLEWQMDHYQIQNRP